MASVVENGLLNNAQALPVGYAGPLRPLGFTLISGSAHVVKLGTHAAAVGGTPELHSFVTGGVNMPGAPLISAPAGDASDPFFAPDGAPALSASFRFPALQTTNQGFARNSAPYDKDYLFGIDHRRTSTESGQDDSYFDIVRELPGGFTHQLNEGEHHPMGWNILSLSLLMTLEKKLIKEDFTLKRVHLMLVILLPGKLVIPYQPS